MAMAVDGDVVITAEKSSVDDLAGGEATGPGV